MGALLSIDPGRLCLDKAYQYAEDVRSGVIPVCKLTRLAVDRWFDDLEHGPSRGLHFSEDAAARIFRFFSNYCRHYQGEWQGQPIELEPWQCFIEANIYGWIREDGSRRFRGCYEEVARKNGKTTRLGGVGLYGLVGDNEPGAKVYCAATKRDQARELFDSSVAMVLQSPKLRSLLHSFRNHLAYKRKFGRMEPLSADSKTMDGLNVHYGLVDELHAHPNSAIWDVLESARGSRRQPLMRGITTSGFDHNSFCYELRTYAVKVLERAHQDDSFFAIIYTIDDPEKWDDPKEWIKANPNLGVSVKLSDLEDQCRKAKEVPSAKVEFLTKRLNIWVYGQVMWMNMEAWRACLKSDFDSSAVWNEHKESELDGLECYGGLDLANVNDMCAFYLAFPNGEKRRLVGRAYLPQAALNERLKRGDKTLQQYVDSGHLVVTPGAVCDYAFIKRDILLAKKRFNLREVAFDRWNSSQLVTDLTEEGVEFAGFGQGYASMNAPMKEITRLAATEERDLEYNDPLLTWAMSNVVACIDPAGNEKPDKSKVSEKIDPAVAAIMAIALAMAVDDHYDEDAAMAEFFDNPVKI